MKRMVFMVMFFVVFFGSFFVSAENINTEEMGIISGEQVGELQEEIEKTKSDLEKYQERYGNKTFGTVAYVLNIVRIYSIPVCFLGIAVSAIYQYMLGIRRLDVRDRGFHNMVLFITFLVIAQLLPLIFALVSIGWRN